MSGAVMETFWATFVAGIVGGLLSYLLTKRLDRGFRPPPSRDGAALEPYPHSALIHGQFRCMYCGQDYTVRQPAVIETD